MYSALFESIIQEYDKYTDELEDSANEANFYARISENLLFEQVLREMAVINDDIFINKIVNKIKEIILTANNKSDWKNNNNRDILEDRLQEEIQQIALDFIQENDHFDNPFVIVNQQGSLLIFNDENEERLRGYSQLLINKHSKKIIRGIRVRNVVRITECNNPPDEIHQWVRNGLDRIKNSITAPEGTADTGKNSGHTLIPSNFNEIFETVFIAKYKELQGLE